MSKKIFFVIVSISVVILFSALIYINKETNQIEYFADVDSLITSKISGEYQIIEKFTIGKRTFYMVNNDVDDTPTFMLFATLEQNGQFILEKSTVRLGLTDDNSLSFGFSVDNIELQCLIHKQGDKYIFEYTRV